MPQFRVADWNAPPVSSPIWCCRSFDLSLPNHNPSDLAFATVQALRHHGCNVAIKYEAVDSSGGHTTMLPFLNDTMTPSFTSTPVGHLVAALCVATEVLASPVELAVSLSVPVLVIQCNLSNRPLLQIMFDSDIVERSRAGWFLIHVAQALHHITVYGQQIPPRDPSSTILERALFEDEDTTTRYDRWHRSFAPPVGNLLQDCLAERVKSDPLAVAITHVDVSPQKSDVSYVSLVALSLQLAEKLGSLDISIGDIVAIRVEDPRYVVISMLAVLMCGAAYVVLNPASADLGVPCRLALLPQFRAVLSKHFSDSHGGDPTCRPFFMDPEDLVLDSTVVLDPQQLSRVSLRPTSLQASATAYFQPCHALDDGSKWVPITHAQAIHDFSSAFDRFGAGSEFRTMHLFTAPDHFLSLSIWHVLLHRSMLCFVPSELKSQLSMMSLIRMTDCTHLVIPFNQIEPVSALLCKALTHTNGNSVSERLHLCSLIVPHLSSSAWEKTRLARTNIRLMVLQGDDPSRVTSILPSDPPEITVLQQKIGTDINPHYVLERLPQGNVIHSMGSRVVQISKDLVVKYGGTVYSLEAQNMLHVRQQTSVPIPDVHLVFKRGDVTYIVMQFIHGWTVQSCWHLLASSQRHHVAAQLAQYIRELHTSSLLAPHDRPGPLNGGKCDGPWFTLYGAGPFETHQELVAWLNHKLALSRSKTSKQFTTYHPLVFTHQDLSPRNLILDYADKLWIIDWEMAGWYPAYMDYACISCDVGTPEVPIPSGWLDTVLPYLPDYAEEYSLLQCIQWVLDTMPFS